MTSLEGEGTVREILNSVAEEVGLEILDEEKRLNALFREKIYGLV
jgi:division protein CdvB (Snf7/Vps24/ESCRT-III family)